MSCSLHDSIELESKGIPTVTICTEGFIDAAKRQVATRGIPDLSIVGIPFPFAALRDDRAVHWLDRDHFHTRLFLFEHFADAGDCAARADATDDDVHLTVGVSPDFFRGRLAMDFWIGRVLELLRHEIVLVLRNQLFRFLHGPGHAFSGRG